MSTWKCGRAKRGVFTQKNTEQVHLQMRLQGGVMCGCVNILPYKGKVEYKREEKFFDVGIQLENWLGLSSFLSERVSP
jgi:hypothetical protein